MKYILGRSVSSGFNTSAAVVFAYDNFLKVKNHFDYQNKEYKYPALIVVDEDRRLLGILTEKDINQIEKRTDIDPKTTHAIDVCNKNPKFISMAELELHRENNTDPFEGLPLSMSFMPVVDDKNRFENFVYNIKFYKDEGLYLAMDIVDSCQLQCPYCIRGTRTMKNSKREMDLDTFSLVVKKAKDYNVNYIDIANFSEPFLKKDVYRYMEILRENDISRRYASSNLSFAKIPNFDRFLESGFTRLYVTVSGFTQEIYKKYHIGGNVEYVKLNLEYASGYINKHKIDSDIVIRFLDFGYNKEEIKDFKMFADRLGFLLEWRNGTRFSMKPYIDETNMTISMLQDYHKVSCDKVTFKVCDIFRTLAMNADGNVYLCVCKPNCESTKIGNFLTNSYEDIMLNKVMNPVCQICNWKKTHMLPERVRAEIIKRMNE
jgi:MoaA/NifB/PqqE/SkfB family radical SAM enzyme